MILGDPPLRLRIYCMYALYGTYLPYWLTTGSASQAAGVERFGSGGGGGRGGASLLERWAVGGWGGCVWPTHDHRRTGSVAWPVGERGRVHGGLEASVGGGGVVETRSYHSGVLAVGPCDERASGADSQGKRTVREYPRGLWRVVVVVINETAEDS
jgi:hypothetical protein